jgi:hypothetical protein
MGDVMPSILSLTCYTLLILALTVLVRWEYQRTRRQDRQHDTEKGT